jgi:SAM-dependent methyltransferase
MSAVGCPDPMPLSGAIWAAKSEAYATFVAKHLSANSVWLDAGCGNRLLERDLDPLENWLAARCKTVVGMDISVTSHRNIKSLVQGSLYRLPFADDSFDLVTCRMVVEHLDDPSKAFTEISRCLRPDGAIIVITPNLHNYGIFCNAVATKLLPEEWRLKLVHSSDARADADIFPVRYRANTMPRLVRLLRESNLQVHQQIGLHQVRPYWKKCGPLETIFMKLTPIHVVMVCAHKIPAKPLRRFGPQLVRSYEGSTRETV